LSQKRKQMVQLSERTSNALQYFKALSYFALAVERLSSPHKSILFPLTKIRKMKGEKTRKFRARATTLLAFLFEFGVGQTKVLGIAEKLYRQSAMELCPMAMSRLIFLKTHGRPGVIIDVEEANHWRRELKKEPHTQDPLYVFLATQGLTEAQYCMALSYYNAIGVEVDKDKAFMWCQEAASAGFAQAQNLLGNLYIEGSKKRKPDYDRGLLCYMNAAAQKESTSIYNIGTLFERGLGVERSLDTALEWYSRAAAFGSANASNVLGIFHEQGLMPQSDLVLAAHHYKKAVKMGHVHSIYNLARLFHEGSGIARNSEQAIIHFEMSAKQDHDMGQLSLGIIHEWGMGVPKDNNKAFSWYFKAAKTSEMARIRLIPHITKEIVNACRVLFTPTKITTGLYSLPIELRVAIVQNMNTASILSPSELMEIVNEMCNNGRLQDAVYQAHENLIQNQVLQKCSCASKECKRILHVFYALKELESR
jgi:TPR repeat protein